MRLAAVLILFAFVAPVRSAEAGTVRIWHALRGDEQRAVETLLLAASERHPGLTVEPLALPYDAFRQRLTNAIPHGNGPDLFIAPHESIGEWARVPTLDATDKVLQPSLTVAHVPQRPASVTAHRAAV